MPGTWAPTKPVPWLVIQFGGDVVAKNLASADAAEPHFRAERRTTLLLTSGTGW